MRQGPRRPPGDDGGRVPKRLTALKAMQRGNTEALADGLRDWLRGRRTLAGEAAGQNVAKLLILFGQSVTDNKWQEEG